MHAAPPITYLPNHQINYRQWDSCMASSANGLPYAYSWYLDAAAPNWGALVMGNYEAVMPLPYRVKWGISYAYKPLWTQQLGVFAPSLPTPNIVNRFLLAIPPHFRYVHYTLNETNHQTISTPNINITTRVNYLLHLGKTYEQLYALFNQSTRRNLKKAQQQAYFVQSNIAPQEVIALYKQTSGKKLTNITDAHYAQIERIMYQSLHHKLGSLVGVYHPTNNQLHAANFFLLSPQNARIINLFPATAPQGKEWGAMHFLINHIIQQYAQTPAVLDFEGSMHPGVSQFYRSFGAEPVPYPQITRNTLPFFIRWLKQ